MSTHTLHVTDAYASVLSWGFYSETWDVIAFAGEDDDTQATVVASFRALADANAYVRNIAPSGAAWGHMIRPPRTVFDHGLAWLQFMAEARHNDGTELTRKGTMI